MDKETQKERSKVDKKDYSGLDALVAGMEETIQKEEREIYTKRTLEEAYNPKNVGELNNPDGAARITGPCGDTLQIHLKVEGDTITDSTFITDGCGASTACGSVITELTKGKTVEEALTIKDKNVLSILGGLPEDNIHCALLAANTLKAALEDYKSKIDWIGKEERR
jgi:nitrogen fixation NifU-like protein